MHANINFSVNIEETPPATPTGILKKSPAPQPMYKSSKSGSKALTSLNRPGTFHHFLSQLLVQVDCPSLCPLGSFSISQYPLLSMVACGAGLTMNECDSFLCMWFMIAHFKSI